jgi:hypothetical protein
LYYNHLIDATCAKNKAARVTTPTAAGGESWIEPTLVRSSSMTAAADDDEVKIFVNIYFGRNSLVKFYP